MSFTKEIPPGSETECWPCRKNARKSAFFPKKLKLPNLLKIFLLVMPKYWGKLIFSHGSFPDMGERQKA